MTERSIFLQALDASTPDERSRYLDSACGDDRGLRARVDELLAAHEAGNGVLDRPVVSEPETGIFEPIAEGPGSVIGPYSLLTHPT